MRMYVRTVCTLYCAYRTAFQDKVHSVITYRQINKPAHWLGGKGGFKSLGTCASKLPPASRLHSSKPRIWANLAIYYEISFRGSNRFFGFSKLSKASFELLTLCSQEKKKEFPSSGCVGFLAASLST